jgi:hypothetical protein
LYPFFYLAPFTGARRGELLNLSWPMVDLAETIECLVAEYRSGTLPPTRIVLRAGQEAGFFA